MAAAWHTGLFAFGEVGSYLGAGLCPCVLLYDVYTTLKHQQQQTVPSPMDPLGPFYAVCLSFCIAPPAIVCMDQWFTRGLDTVADRQRQGQGAPQPPPPSDYPPHQQDQGLLSYILHTNHFGETDHRRPPPPPPASWEQDGVGWDLRDNSEDFWPLSWCSHYTSELCSAACYCRAIGGQAPRLPLCYSLLIALIYPLTICPITFMLRRLVADQWGIAEPYPYTCLLAACCTPCALVQTAHEVHHQSAHLYTHAHTDAPFFPSTMMRMADTSIENFHC